MNCSECLDKVDFYPNTHHPFSGRRVCGVVDKIVDTMRFCPLETRPRSGEQMKPTASPSPTAQARTATTETTTSTDKERVLDL